MDRKPETEILMHTLGDMIKALNRSPVYLAGLQTRFELPVFEGAAYSNVRRWPVTIALFRHEAGWPGRERSF